MRGGELRQWARLAISQNLSALVRMGLLYALLFLPFGVVYSQVPKLFPQNPLAASLVQLLLSLGSTYALAPYIVGCCRQVMEIFRNQTPSASGAFSWFRDPLKCRRAYGIMAGVCLLLLPLQLASWAANYFWVTPNLNPERLLQLPVVVSLLLSFLTGTWSGCLLPALFLQAADCGRTPMGCLKAGLGLFARHMGGLLGMQLVIYLQLLALAFAGTFAFLLASYSLLIVSEVLFGICYILALAGLILLVLLFTAYQALNAFLFTRTVLLEETGEFTLVD